MPSIEPIIHGSGVPIQAQRAAERADGEAPR